MIQADEGRRRYASILTPSLPKLSVLSAANIFAEGRHGQIPLRLYRPDGSLGKVWSDVDFFVSDLIFPDLVTSGNILLPWWWMDVWRGMVHCLKYLKDTTHSHEQLDTHDYFCRDLCRRSGTAVVAVDYRLVW